MQVGYLECFAGISGDMMMAALVDAGAPFEPMRQVAAALGLGAELRLSKVNRSGIQSAKIDVVVNGGAPEAAAHSEAHEHGAASAPHHEAHRHHGCSLTAIRKILMDAPLSEGARSLSMSAFDLLAGVEARIHGIPVEKVHFHEVGAVDAIVDIACCAVAVDALALDRWYASAVNVGGGYVDCAHGRFPVPAPATAELLMGAPVYSAGPQVELTTPTGAALLRAVNCQFEAVGVMRARSIGYGAGTRNPERFPNVLRVTLGEIGEAKSFDEEKVTVLECAIDDLSPEVLAHTAQLALERGALDVMTSPVTMKKGRLGTLLTVLSKPADAGDLEELLFRETTTLGMRVREESRLFLARETAPVETEFGIIRVKAGFWRGEELNAAPEFEDCRRAAEAHHVPLKSVMEAALAQWRRGLAANAGAGERR